MAAIPLEKINPSSGWKAKLELAYVARPERTVLARSSRRGPLAVQRAFYPEDGVCHSYVLHPPGGVVGGDELIIDVTVEAEAHALLTTPGATKFYRSAGPFAEQIQQFKVEEGGALEWLPQETIFFPGACAGLKTQIQLHPKASYLGWEVHCLGRPTNQETFDSGELLFQTDIQRDGEPLYKERLQLDNPWDLQGMAGLSGYPVMATMLALPAGNDALELARQACKAFGGEGYTAPTLLDDVLVVRYLGNSTEQAHHLFRKIWLAIRPLVNGRLAVAPRIWAT